MAQDQQTFKCNIKPERVKVSKHKRIPKSNINVIKKSDLTGLSANSTTKTEFCNEISDSVREENKITHSKNNLSICNTISLLDDVNQGFNGKANQSNTQFVSERKRISTSNVKTGRKRKVNSTSKFCYRTSDAVTAENKTTDYIKQSLICETFDLHDGVKLKNEFDVNEKLKETAVENLSSTLAQKKRTSRSNATRKRKSAATNSLPEFSNKIKLFDEISNGIEQKNKINDSNEISNHKLFDTVAAENKTTDSNKQSLICKTFDLPDGVKLKNEFDFNEKLKEATVQTLSSTLAQKKRTCRSNATKKRKSAATSSLAGFSNEIKLHDEISEAIEQKNKINDGYEISNYRPFDILKNTTEKRDFIEKTDKVIVKPCSQNKLSNHLSKSNSSLNISSNLRSVIDKVRNLEVQPSIHIYTIMPEGKGLSAVDVSQNLSHLAFSFPHSHEIHVCARKSLSNDITRNDIKSTWVNFASARNQLKKVAKSEKEKTECLSSPQNYIFNHTDDVSGLCFSSDDNLLLSCSLDGTVKIISTNTYRILEHYNGYGVFTDIDINTRSTQFVTVSTLSCKPFYAVYLYDLERKNPVTCFSGHENSLKCVRFHPNGLYIATAATDNCIKLWSVHQNKEVRSFKDEGLNHPQKITFSPDGKYIVSTHNGCIKIWDIASSTKLKSLEVSASESCKLNICYNYTGSMLAAGGSDKKIHIWNSTTYESSEMRPDYELLKSECLNKSIFSIKYAANFFSCVTG